MSDQSFGLHDLIEELSQSYSRLGVACLHLPIPVRLPVDSVSPREAADAVERLIAIVEDQLVPEERILDLQIAATNWLMAMDLTALQADSPRPYRIAGAFLALGHAEDYLAELMEWFHSQPGGS